MSRVHSITRISHRQCPTNNGEKLDRNSKQDNTNTSRLILLPAPTMAFLTALATPATKKRTTSFAKTPPRYASATKSLFKTPRAASAQKKSRKSMDKVNEESVKG